MKVCTVLFLALLLTSVPGVAPCRAEVVTHDHSVGLSYISGFTEITDFYEKSFYVDGDGGLPIGLLYDYTANFSSGFRIGAGIGPICLIGGDLEYYDVPLRLQGGFTIVPGSPVRPYLKAGFSYHISDGDYIEDEAAFGLLGTAGVEFGRRGKISGFFEISYDTAEATFNSGIAGPMNFARKSPTRKEDIKVNGVVVSAGVTF
jgi:hypothetical protein